MLAWMNAASVAETLATGRVCYWSRSRGAFWRKGETSGQVQRLVELRVDCDERLAAAAGGPDMVQPATRGSEAASTARYGMAPWWC